MEARLADVVGLVFVETDDDFLDRTIGFGDERRMHPVGAVEVQDGGELYLADLMAFDAAEVEVAQCASTIFEGDEGPIAVRMEKMMGMARAKFSLSGAGRVIRDLVTWE